MASSNPAEAERERRQITESTNNGLLIGFLGGAIAGGVMEMKIDQPSALARDKKDGLLTENALLAKLDHKTGKYDIKQAHEIGKVTQRTIAENKVSIAKLQKTIDGGPSLPETFGIFIGPAIVGALAFGVASYKFSDWRIKSKQRHADQPKTA